MTFTVAVAGKGGVGKTSVSALILKHLIERKKGIALAVDADPNSNLHEKLGLALVKTIGNLREELSKNINSLPAGVSKAEHIDYQLRTAICEGAGFDLLVMGRPEGPGCYCYVNSLLRTILDTIAQKYAYVVIDNEAGMEHLSRRTSMGADALVVVSDASPTGLQTAARIAELSREMELKVGKTVLIVNRLADERKTPEGPFPGFDRVYTVPEDPILNAYNCENKSLLGLPADSKSRVVMKKIMVEICP